MRISDVFILDDSIKKVRDKQETVQQQEFKHIGKYMLRKGLKLYQYDLDTDEYSEVQIEKELIVDIDGKVKEKKKAYSDIRCIYFQALNDKNARKKTEKIRKRLREIGVSGDKQ